MTFAAQKAQAKAAIAGYVADKSEVVVDDVRRLVERESGLDYAASSIAKLLKGVGFERDEATNGARYRRAA